MSYYARATDNDARRRRRSSATSDIYFLRIRPFDKDFKPATSMSGGGGGGGGGGQEVGALSQQQRQIIAGTFNVQRDRKKLAAEKFRESMVVLTLAQSKLREQVKGLVERMNSRLVVPDPSFKKIAELLPKAAEQMTAAEKKLQAQSPDGALPPENMALQYLQQAEEEFELQVQTQRQAGGGGGGGGAGSIAEDLADLFKLEMDKMANQYETNSQASTAAAGPADRRARRETEGAGAPAGAGDRAAAAAGGGPVGGLGSGDDLQRALAEQAEEAARQLERLSRDQNRQDLADTARQLRNAADAMRRAAAKGDPSAAGQAAAAAERLREAQRQLTRNQTARGERDVKDAQRQAEEIAEEQQDISADARGLPQTGPDRMQQAQLLGQRKDALENKVAASRSSSIAWSARQSRDNRDSSRGLGEAAAGIRDNKLKEKIRYSKSLLGSGAPEQYARNFEEEIGANIEQLRRKLDEAGERGRPDGARSHRRRGGQGARARARRGLDGPAHAGARRGTRARASRANRSQRPTGSAKVNKVAKVNKAAKANRAKDNRASKVQRGCNKVPTVNKASKVNRARPARASKGSRAAAADRTMAAHRRRTRWRRRHLGGWRDGGWGGYGDRRPDGGWFTPDDIRQFRGEARRWTQEGAGAAQHAARAEPRSEGARRDHAPAARARFRARLPGRRGARAAADVRRRRLEAIRVRAAPQGRRRSRSRAGQRHRRSAAGVHARWSRSITGRCRRGSRRRQVTASRWRVALPCSSLCCWRRRWPRRSAGGAAGAAAGAARPARRRKFPNAPTSTARLHFCRLMYRSVRSQQRGLGWGTDYPYADINFSIRLSELTKTQVGMQDGEPNHLVVRPTDRSCSNARS